MQPKKSVGLAVASMVLGILSIVCWCNLYLSLPMGIVGLVLGVVSVKGDKGGKGMAITGIVLSIVCIALVALAIIGCSTFNYSTGNMIDNIFDSSEVFDF